ncbi:hypothetical protein ACH5RR_040503, partial [Cinchona calisaya]
NCDAETKLSGSNATEACLKLPFSYFEIVDAQGFKGGIWMLWNETKVKVDIVDKIDQSIQAVIQVHPNGFPWLLSAIYASPNFHTRMHYWDNLRNVASNCPLLWLLVGDFNKVLNGSEKMGGNPINKKRSAIFNDFIHDCQLMDLGFFGPKFTWWCKRRDGPIIHERLDRTLCNSDWCDLSKDAFVQHIVRTGSDHRPIPVSTKSFSFSAVVGKEKQPQLNRGEEREGQQLEESNFCTSTKTCPKSSQLDTGDRVIQFESFKPITLPLDIPQVEVEIAPEGQVKDDDDDS